MVGGGSGTVDGGSGPDVEWTVSPVWYGSGQRVRCGCRSGQRGGGTPGPPETSTSEMEDGPGVGRWALHLHFSETRRGGERVGNRERDESQGARREEDGEHRGGQTGPGGCVGPPSNEGGDWRGETL